MLVNILQIIAAIGTVATGLVSVIAPKSVKGFTGLEAPGARGITEIRAILGGVFVAVGVVPLIVGGETYLMLGITYFVVAAVRAVSMVVDKSIEQSNIISLIVEIVFGIILVL